MPSWVAIFVCLLLIGSCYSVKPVQDKYKVKLRVFYRAFCPACQWFVGDPLLELVRNEQFRNILDFAILPVAGMREQNGEFSCEDGQLECTGHRWQACAINKDKDDVAKYVGSVACIEGDESGGEGEWETKISNCFTNEEREVLQECMDKRADTFLREMIAEPGFSDVSWMPYTSINGMVLGSASRGVDLSELQTHICRQFRGPNSYYPDVCKTLVGEQEVVAKEESTTEAVSIAPINTIVPITPTVDANKVRLEVYWRAFCPGCMSFVTRPLYQLFQDEEFRDIIDFHPVPAAGTWYDPATQQFVCNKGMMECVGHQLFSCVIHEFPDSGQQVTHLACLERRDNKGESWEFIVNKCFSSNTEEYNRMRACFDKKSSELLLAHIATRERITLQWVPYVLLNGRVIGDRQTGITFKLLQQEVCASYTGSIEYRPSACSPKRLRGDEQAPVQEEAKEDKAIKPCPPKKDATEARETMNNDAPGAGFRRSDDTRDDAKPEMNGEFARARGEDDSFKPTVPSSFSLQSLVFPLGCFAILAVLAKRLSGDHKKYA